MRFEGFLRLDQAVLSTILEPAELSLGIEVFLLQMFLDRSRFLLEGSDRFRLVFIFLALAIEGLALDEDLVEAEVLLVRRVQGLGGAVW